MTHSVKNPDEIVLEDVKMVHYETMEEGGAREDMSIAEKDLAIAVARAILEAYGEV